jgi:aryl-alcohol dehydrogenase-like predicted oxidoreductase
MRYSKLGSTPLEVSRVCLGTMTWGVQNTQADADEQIEYSLSQGVNFIDTAEMYAVPPSPDTFGKTELIIGDWLARNPTKRSDIILASKITGSGLPWIRNGGEITGAAVEASVDASLQRLQTDYIDLYQLHWPNRTSPSFGRHHEGMWSFENYQKEAVEADFVDILQGLQRCIESGKIKYFGLSNETPWGIQMFMRTAEKYGLPKPVSIQNEFSLLMHKDWPYTLETCHYEDVAYLPWSPLATGALSGKYLNDAMPEGSRWSLSHRHGLFRQTPGTDDAVKDYVALAKAFDMTPSQLALAWCDQVEGVTSTIIGATTMDQLKDNFSGFEITLSEDQLAAIRELLKRHSTPF